MKIKYAAALLLSVCTLVSYAGEDGPWLKLMELPFKHVLLSYKSWWHGSDSDGVYFIYHFTEGHRVKCVIENAHAGKISAAWNAGSMSFTGNKTVIFTSKQPTGPDEYYVQPNTPQVFIEDDAPKNWKSYASCQVMG